MNRSYNEFISNPIYYYNKRNYLKKTKKNRQICMMLLNSNFFFFISNLQYRVVFFMLSYKSSQSEFFQNFYSFSYIFLYFWIFVIMLLNFWFLVSEKYRKELYSHLGSFGFEKSCNFYQSQKILNVIVHVKQSNRGGKWLSEHTSFNIKLDSNILFCVFVINL